MQLDTRSPGSPAPEFDLSGGILCLDFANTVSKRKVPGRTHDDLPAYSDLIRFAKQARVISPQYARDLLVAGLAEPRKTAQVLQRAVVLREAIYRVFSAIAGLRAAASADVKLIEEFAAEAMKHRHLVTAGRNYRWEWNRDKDEALACMLWPIGQSASDLLTSDRRKKVRMCAAPTCAWLFLDKSRNHSRRWCDMSVCGNRQKARRHYQRQHT